MMTSAVVSVKVDASWHVRHSSVFENALGSWNRTGGRLLCSANLALSSAPRVLHTVQHYSCGRSCRLASCMRKGGMHVFRRMAISDRPAQPFPAKEHHFSVFPFVPMSQQLLLCLTLLGIDVVLQITCDRTTGHPEGVLLRSRSLCITDPSAMDSLVHSPISCDVRPTPLADVPMADPVDLTSLTRQYGA